MKKVYYSVLLIIAVLLLFVYNNNFFMFKVVNFIDEKSAGKIPLIETRNSLMHFVDDVNPFKGKLWDDNENLPVINLSLSRKNFQHIESTIQNARLNSPYAYYMPNELNEFFSTNIYVDGKKYKSEVKLHGTNNPHFDREKKSYSIKIRKNKNKDYPYNIRRFALVIPSQSNLIGLFTYKVANMLGMVTPKNFLVRVYINGIDQGIYHLEEKLNKTLLERNNMSGYDILRSDDSWAHQYANNHGTFFSFDYSGISPKITSGKSLDQMVIFKKILNTNDIDYIKQHINLKKFIVYDVLRYLFGDSGHMTSNDNIKLLYNTSTARIEPYFRIENHIEKIITNKLTHSPEQHVNIGMFTTNSLLFNLTKDDEYRDLRNKAIYNVVKNRNKIIDIFDKVMEKDLGSLTNDTTNDLPSRYFAFEAEEAKNKLLHNFDFLQKYLEYSRAFVEIIRQDKSTHLIKIMPDSNSSIIATKFKIYVDKSFVGSDVFLEDLESKTKYDLSINIDSNRNKGFIDLGKVLKDRKFSLSLDEHLEPKKNIYKYNLFFNDRVDSLDMTFANNISGKSLLNRDMYEAIVDESGYIHPTIPSFIDKSRTEKNTLYVKEGEHIISKDIVLPYGINLVVNQGTVLKFKNNASLLINGGLKIDGKQNNPVRIVNNSKNNIFGSVGVVGDGETKVDISFLEVYGGSEDFINGMHLSGGLSIHNHKEVKIENSSIHHNMADDGVNIKNSNFLIKNSKFYANMADQIDIDFGTGVISDSYFSQSSLIDVFTNVLAKKDDNGDGLDLSGSEVIVENNLFKGFLDKGMSIGENTHALIVNNRFNNNRSAITSKDQSKVYINNNNFINNQIDIEMYQKKKFFNHPSVYSLSKDNVDLTIKKTDKSKFFKIKGAINLDKKLDSSIFSLLGQLLWIEYE